MKLRKKLIEVALPLEAINVASAREKSIRHGHPSTLHLWWARRPLAAARAVIFSQMVDDPSGYTNELLANPDNRRLATEELERRRKLWIDRNAMYERAGRDGQTTVPAPGPESTLEECAADLERERLFEIIKELVQWENTTNETVLNKAREEIWKSWRRTCADNQDHPRATELFNPDKLPAFHDPFAGGGSLPLEAQRLGLEAYASDLNPVAVLINKAMIEIPPKFAGQPPVNPESRRQGAMAHKKWHGAQGLAEDVRYYGQWMRDEAEKRIGHLYPKVEITAEIAKERPDLKQHVGQELTVIGWFWAHTVKSPNPAFSDIDVPLASTFMLSTKDGKEAYVQPVITNKTYKLTVKSGKPKDPEAANNGTSAGKRKAFRCLLSNVPIGYDYIRAEAKAGRMGSRLMAVVAEGDRGRVYLSPTRAMEEVASGARPEWKPDCEMPQKHRNFQPPVYGMNNLGDIFTARQLVALNTFSDLVHEVREQVKKDGAGTVSMGNDATLSGGGSGGPAYAEAVAVYLALATSRASDAWSMLVSWRNGVEATRGTFARQALAMVWDYTEVNPFSNSCGNWIGACLEWIVESVSALPATASGGAVQSDAASQPISIDKVVSTDPPYYDNIAYADLSDYFYAWLRHGLKSIFPDLFATVAAPKTEELIAAPHRHGGKEKAEEFFLSGMTRAMHSLAEQTHPAFPVTIYYAFKQAETESAGTASTGWETFLSAVIRAGFSLKGTWPMRTEKQGRVISNDANALASSIVLVCGRRDATAPIATRRELLSVLKTELPTALTHLQRGNIAPVDLAQAAIGPGMGVFTRYAKVVDAEGKPLPVREALALINQTLDEVLAEQEGDFDADTRWALAWFEQAGFDEGEFGVAETLSKAKNTSISGLEHAKILKSKAGKVRLLRPDELPADWNPLTDSRLTVWEAVHHLLRRLEQSGEAGAAELAAVLGSVAETARELAYRLYTICERKKRSEEALSYNALVQSWPEITRLAREEKQASPQQAGMFA